MRLWTIHPSLLDRTGLVAEWREGLLAQAVLLGKTRGYTQHPQLHRFRRHAHPTAAIGVYLAEVRAEAERRGYNFDASRIVQPPPAEPLSTIYTTSGQLEYEWEHLLQKLAVRAPDLRTAHAALPGPTAHPLFTIIPGPIESWERP